MASVDKVGLVVDEQNIERAPPPSYEPAAQDTGVPMMPAHTFAPVPQPPAQYPVISQPNTTVIVQQGLSQELPKPPYPQRVRPWTTGLCDCCSDMSICLMGCFCGPCHACQVASRLDESCCTPCCAGPGMMRTKFRTQMGIAGTLINDACVGSCCPACVICQIEREMNNWGI